MIQTSDYEHIANITCKIRNDKKNWNIKIPYLHCRGFSIKYNYFIYNGLGIPQWFLHCYKAFREQRLQPQPKVKFWFQIFNKITLKTENIILGTLIRISLIKYCPNDFQIWLAYTMTSRTSPFIFLYYRNNVFF